MVHLVQDPQFGEIIDYEHLRECLVPTYERLFPGWDMLGAIRIGHDMMDEHPGYLVAGGASILAWSQLLAAEEYELAEETMGQLFTLGWTEEHTGTDLLSMKTHATPMSDDPDERQYHVKGQKWLINNSYHADYHLVVAKLDPEQDGPRSLSFFLVPHSSTKNWERLDTHVLTNMVLTKFEIDGPGTLVGKPGHGLSMLQRMAMPSKYICSYVGVRMIKTALTATIDHLSTKTIFKDQPVNFSNVYRQLYNIVLEGAFLDFAFHRAMVFSDSSFLGFHGTMLKSWLLLRINELLSQNWLVAGSKGFLKESVIGRNAIDSFVLPVFDGHYTLNTLMTGKHMSRYLAATDTGNMEERISQIREKIYVEEAGGQMNKSPREIRHPKFFDYAQYWQQLDVPLDIDAEAMLQAVRDLMTELNEKTHDNGETRYASEAEYKYKTGTLVHWLEAVLAAAEFWKVMGDDRYLNVIVQQYNKFVTTFNDIVSEGNLDAPFMIPARQRPIPQAEDNEAMLRDLLDVKSKLLAMREPAVGD